MASFLKSVGIGFLGSIANQQQQNAELENDLIKEGFRNFQQDFLPRWQKEKQRLEQASVFGKMIGSNYAEQFGPEYGDQMAKFITKYGSGNPADDLKLASMFKFKPAAAAAGTAIEEAGSAMGGALDQKPMDSIQATPTETPQQPQPTMKGRDFWDIITAAPNAQGVQKKIANMAGGMPGVPKDAMEAFLSGAMPGDDIQLDTSLMSLRGDDPFADQLAKSYMGDLGQITNREAVIAALKQYSETGDPSAIYGINPVYRTPSRGGGSSKTKEPKPGDAYNNTVKTNMDLMAALVAKHGNANVDEWDAADKAAYENAAGTVQSLKSGVSTAKGASDPMAELMAMDAPPQGSPAASKAKAEPSQGSNPPGVPATARKFNDTTYYDPVTDKTYKIGADGKVTVSE